jgi:hypothetical protein
MTARMFTSGFCSRSEAPRLPSRNQRLNQAMFAGPDFVNVLRGSHDTDQRLAAAIGLGGIV